MEDTLNQIVGVILNNAHDIKHYERLGYDLPKTYNKYTHKDVVKYGTSIDVKLCDTQDHWLIGKIFGHLTVLEYDYVRSEQMHGKQKYRYWVCECDCGTKKKVFGRKTYWMEAS